jgi:hypothetical protein
MSRYAKLIINNREADAFSIQDIPINLKSRISNLEGDPAGNFTRSTLTIPATKNNKSILDGVLDFVPFRIDVNGETRLSGLLQVKGGAVSNDCYNCVLASFEVALFGGNSDWFLQLRSCTLDQLTTETVIFDETPIDDGLNADPATDNSGFCFIKWHEWQNSRQVTESAQGGGQLRQLESPSYFESTPFLFILPLVVEAFRKVGYQIQSNFLNSDFFKRLLLPVPLPDKMPEIYNELYLNIDVQISAGFITPILGSVFLNMPLDQINTAPANNPGAWDTILFKYTAPEDGFYELTIIGGFTQPEINTGATFVSGVKINGIIKGGPTDVQIKFGTGFTGPTPTIPYPTGLLSDSQVYQLNKGDTVEVIYFTYAGAVRQVGIDSFQFLINGEAQRGPGLLIDFSTLLTKFDALPMLKDLAIKYKLGFETNTDTKTVLIEPLDPYTYTQQTPTPVNETREGYYFINNPEDLSKKIDFSRKVEHKIPVLDGFFNFSYLSDDEETIRFIEEGNKIVLYEAIFNSPNGSDKNKTKEVKTDFFAKTLHVRDNLTRYPDTPIQPQFPLIYPVNYVLDPTATPDEANYDVSPRILYWAGQRGGLDGFMEIFENPGVAQPVPAAFMVNYNDVSGLDPSLSFSAEKVNGLTVPGLVERFHKHCLSRLKQREQKKAFICSNSIDRDNFTFRNRVLIGGKRYIVFEVESVNPLQNTPDRFLLVRDEFADQACVDLIENSNVRGVVSLFT